jgi:hypothetical protein
MNHSLFESSLLVPLTNAQTPPRDFQLTRECGVICLSRVIRALNLTPARTFEDLAIRRECAAMLIFLRIEIHLASIVLCVAACILLFVWMRKLVRENL